MLATGGLWLRDTVHPLTEPVESTWAVRLLGGLVIGFVVTLVVSFGAAIRNAAPVAAPSPEQSWQAHLRYLAAGHIAPVAVVVGLLSAGYAAADPQFTLADVTPVLASYGTVIILVLLLVETAGQYAITAALLALRGRTPWRLLRFFRDAHQRGVLHQQGSTYLFRHARLRERLTTRP